MVRESERNNYVAKNTVGSTRKRSQAFTEAEMWMLKIKRRIKRKELTNEEEINPESALLMVHTNHNYRQKSVCLCGWMCAYPLFIQLFT